MKKLCLLFLGVMLSGCTTEYILMDENNNPINEDYYTKSNILGDEFYVGEEDVAGNDFVVEDSADTGNGDATFAETDFEGGVRNITANDVFVVGEGADYVTYQYKNVRVDEISPMASMYCSDVAFGGSPYLREVSIYHNGFMRATFDCVSLAI